LVGKATTDTLTNKTLTGAAMNGTVGATTPATGAFTTLTSTSASSFATSSGNVGIGTSSPTQKITANGSIRLTGNSSNFNETGAQMDSYDGLRLASYISTGSAIQFLTNASGGNTQERARFNSTGALVFAGGTTTADGIGITFPATQSASTNANTLDDYEEGTWTPTVTSGNYTASATAGTYTKIGRLVYCRFNITFSAVSGSSNSNCVFTGFPFYNGGSSTPGVAREDTNTGTIYVVYIDTTGVGGALNSYSGVANGSARTLAINENYICSITYQTS
jgi:hypothetical protein